MSSDTLSEQIATDLVQEILHGRYAPGERLPSERELATRFGASRGAVREAVRRMEHLGVIAVHPGGARIVPVEQSTLEVLGPLLDLRSPPDPELVDQILLVMNALMELAARNAVVRASDAQISAARSLIGRLRQADLEDSERFNVRIELGRLFMAASGNLVLQLISNSLRLQFERRVQPPSAAPDVSAGHYIELLDQLDTGLATRNADQVHGALQTIFELNRQAVASLLAAAHSNSSSHSPYPAWQHAAGG